MDVELAQYRVWHDHLPPLAQKFFPPPDDWLSVLTWVGDFADGFGSAFLDEVKGAITGIFQPYIDLYHLITIPLARSRRSGTNSPGCAVRSGFH